MSLPDEIWLYIIEHLDVKSLCTICQVSIRFHQLTHDEIFLKEYCGKLSMPLIFPNAQHLTLYKPNDKSWDWFLRAYHSKNDSQIGRLSWANGIYYGDLHNNQPHGSGIYNDLKCIYTGCWTLGNKNGNGKLYTKDKVFEGTFENNQRHIGTCVYSDNNKFIGTYQNEMRLYGTYQWPIGDVYIGEWYQGHPHGCGEYRWADGRCYIGTWVNNYCEKFGFFKFPDGHKYKGNWEKGHRAGFGIFQYQKNILYQGFWKDDRPVDNTILKWNGFFLLSYHKQRQIMTDTIKK